MKALFLCQYVNGSPNLPPMRDEAGGLQIAYTVDGKERGGWVVMSPPKPGDPPTAVVMVESSDETLDAIAELPNVAFIEEVADAEASQA
jgi:hypothetical protein